MIGHGSFGSVYRADFKKKKELAAMEQQEPESQTILGFS